MGKLVYNFGHNKRKYTRIKHQFLPKSGAEKINKITKFLQFCESQQVQKIKDIKQKHYDQFMQKFSEKKLSDETIRKYAAAEKEFITRAHLEIQINPGKAYRTKQQKKLNKIMTVITENIDIDPDAAINIAAGIQKIL